MAREDVTRSLFDVEDVEVMPKVRETIIAPVTPSDVQQFTHRYHYSGVGNNAMWRWGLWHGATLLGVVAYNLPTRDACASVFGPAHLHQVWHMGRLAMADSAPHNSESRLISGSLREIAKNHDVWGVLTYADTTVGHIGYVYQATNAIYTGLAGDSIFYTDTSGKRRSTYLDGASMGRARAEGLGWTRHKGGKKHRYVYILGNKAERRARRALLRLPVLPYPKGDVA